jgi:hypothetical protein
LSLLAAFPTFLHMTNAPPPDHDAARLAARQERKARYRQQKLAERAAARQASSPAAQQPQERAGNAWSNALGPFGQRIMRIATNMVIGRIIGMILNAIIRGLR